MNNALIRYMLVTSALHFINLILVNHLMSTNFFRVTTFITQIHFTALCNLQHTFLGNWWRLWRYNFMTLKRIYHPRCVITDLRLLTMEWSWDFSGTLSSCRSSTAPRACLLVSWCSPCWATWLTSPIRTSEKWPRMVSPTPCWNTMAPVWLEALLNPCDACV